MQLSVRTPAPRSARLAAIALAFFLGACDEKLSDVAGPTPDLTPTFDSVLQDVFLSTDAAGRTACANCHTGRLSVVSLNFRATDVYSQIVNVPSRERPELMLVAPGNPDASYLVHKIEGRPGIVGLRMPLNGPPYLTPGQISIIRRWIELGAPR